MVSNNSLRDRLKGLGDKKGGGQLPNLRKPLQSSRPSPTPSELHHAITRALGLTQSSQDWIMRRAIAYHSGPGRSWTMEEQDYAAAIDLFRDGDSRR